MSTKHPSINPGSFGLMDFVSQVDTWSVNRRMAWEGRVFRVKKCLSLMAYGYSGGERGG
jgi:hypothetical protein